MPRRAGASPPYAGPGGSPSGARHPARRASHDRAGHAGSGPGQAWTGGARSERSGRSEAAGRWPLTLRSDLRNGDRPVEPPMEDDVPVVGGRTPDHAGWDAGTGVRRLELAGAPASYRDLLLGEA